MPIFSGGNGGGGGGTVTSVNGDAGPAVSLDLDDVPDGATSGKIALTNINSGNVTRLVDASGNFLSVADLNGSDVSVSFDSDNEPYNFDQNVGTTDSVQFGTVDATTRVKTLGDLITGDTFSVLNFDTYAAGNNTILTKSLNIKTAITPGGDTMTLPDATTIPGKIIIIKDGSGFAGTDPITIDSVVGSIDGDPSIQLVADYSTVILYCDGSNYLILSWS